jgi:hypothetical protein
VGSDREETVFQEVVGMLERTLDLILSPGPAVTKEVTFKRPLLLCPFCYLQKWKLLNLMALKVPFSP